MKNNISDLAPKKSNNLKIRIMTPEEKADQLIYKYLPLLYGKKKFYKNSNLYMCRKCALVLVDEIIEQFTNKCCESANVRYWKEVKKEILLR